jgi:CPA1 family monovalent cation:H+ antiporter
VTPETRAGDCEHLEKAPKIARANTPDGCEECLIEGTRWVHLRLCLTCGHVGCCDSSPMRHARAHAQTAHHPIVQSLEPGEAWRWCYAHSAYV